MEHDLCVLYSRFFIPTAQILCELRRICSRLSLQFHTILVFLSSSRRTERSSQRSMVLQVKALLLCIIPILVKRCKRLHQRPGVLPRIKCDFHSMVLSMNLDGWRVHCFIATLAISASVSRSMTFTTIAGESAITSVMQ